MTRCSCGCDKWEEMQGQIGEDEVIYSKCKRCGTVYVTPSKYYGQTQEEDYISPDESVFDQFIDEQKGNGNTVKWNKQEDSISLEEIAMFRWECAKAQDLNGNYQVNWKELTQ